MFLTLFFNFNRFQSITQCTCKNVPTEYISAHFVSSNRKEDVCRERSREKKKKNAQKKRTRETAKRKLEAMAIQDVEFSREELKVRKAFG